MATRYGGNFSRYKKSDLLTLADKLKNGESMESLTAKLKYYSYYKEAYNAVLSGFVGKYRKLLPSKEDSGRLEWRDGYGLKAFSPLAEGYPFSHYDDFGAGRSYGYKRTHLGHDMLAATGVPVVAVESGVVEVMGWNRYGGWRIGIRSFDGLRYYYYAHLRKDHPYHCDMAEGKTVRAGDVIGYVGRSGYSAKENTNNIKQPHLHWGMQLIFDESQKTGPKEIWVDVYALTLLLQKNRSTVKRAEGEKDYYRKYDFVEESGESA